MSINLQFSDRNSGGFKFGQMTMTGYKYVVVLDRDYPEHGWKKNDMIAVSLDDRPCFRIEPLFDSGLSYDHRVKLDSFRHTDKEFKLTKLT